MTTTIVQIPVVLGSPTTPNKAGDNPPDGDKRLSNMQSHESLTAANLIQPPANRPRPPEEPGFLSAGITYEYYTANGINRTEAYDNHGWLATFTEGARTVALRGTERIFTEPTTGATVQHDIWVRLLPQPFRGVPDAVWLDAQRANQNPDALSYAMRYIAGAPTVVDATGRIVASDADFGPLKPDGTRAEGSDFNDYLGITMQYGAVTDDAEPEQLGALDCSGYMRMIWGHWLGVPLIYPETKPGALPRRAIMMHQAAPGVITLPRSEPMQLGLLQPGDLVFFDVSADDGSDIDHVGMFLGLDKGGHYRFISSRKVANGPTMGDAGGNSVIDGTGLYARSFAGARRL